MSAADFWYAFAAAVAAAAICATLIFTENDSE